MLFIQPLPKLSPLREAIASYYHKDENEVVDRLLIDAALPQSSVNKIQDTARRLVREVRSRRLDKGGIDAFLYQYDLSSTEGIALMCMAEALLRIPDAATMDDLLRDKITAADWAAHVGQSASFFVNAATWGLLLTGKILSPQEALDKPVKTGLRRFIERSSAPVIRQAVKQAMKLLGRQFVMGENIEDALKRSSAGEKQGYRYSFDMLGEAARTAKDAERYFKAYNDAIVAIGKHAQGAGVIYGPGISIKLSALHPRYEIANYEEVMASIVPQLTKLASQARKYDIGLTIDAEESERLDLSLDIIEAVFCDPALAGWEGFGLAVQSYQKRALPLIDWLIDLARKQRKRIMIRLIKGAYWDSEIKNAQVRGFIDYPVFTRKMNTDVSFLACAKKILSAPDAFYGQFATHNAYSVAAVLEMAGDRRDFEFQCLHGMGYSLYDQIVGKDKMNLPCRVYAPVGGHEDLLPYLVRRLLENGANTSFVNRIIDAEQPIEDIIADPVAKVRSFTNKRHPGIPLPRDIYGTRKNSTGIDLSDLLELRMLDQAMEKACQKEWYAAPIINGKEYKGETRAVLNPANKSQKVGEVSSASLELTEQALEYASQAAERWDQTPIEKRAACLERAADLLEQRMPEFMAIAVREAGKSIPDSVGEVREAVDFCRYYAEQARKELVPKVLVGPTGEFNQLSLHGRGVIACISPWNFPLAIFAGQVTAALAAGNCVIAKPADQTPLIACAMVRLLHEAGIPGDVLQFLPGRGSVVGARMVQDERVKGIVFTGSTETARMINQTLANREGAIPLLIAETGGQNVMVVDSSALPEQVVSDILSSSFNSAGQRCSALRVLFVQEEIAPKLIEMLGGAMAELKVGNPLCLRTDVGPVIDKSSKETLETHVQHMEQEAPLLFQAKLPSDAPQGTFMPPSVLEISDIGQLKREVFGPVLHVIRFAAKDLDKVITAINSTGYGLTLGIQSRINSTIETIQKNVKVGNIYVNRNIIGAVVGVQPFGGEGLSGTGPKAGGPHYLPRLCNERAICINTTASGGNASLLCLED